jgi:predicted nucleotidyltransferase
VSLTDTNKLNFINTIKEKLSQFSEVNKVILFGSFIKSSNLNDNFLTVSLKYRKVLRELSRKYH